MRTNIEIDDKLMGQAMRASGLKTKRAVVEEGLRLLVQRRRQMNILKYFGKFKVDRVRDEEGEGKIDRAAE